MNVPKQTPCKILLLAMQVKLHNGHLPLVDSQLVTTSYTTFFLIFLQPTPKLKGCLY